LLTRSVPVHEFARTHGSLELHLVLRHRPTPLKSSDTSIRTPQAHQPSPIGIQGEE
jgi:hypothetical protein